MELEVWYILTLLWYSIIFSTLFLCIINPMIPYFLLAKCITNTISPLAINKCWQQNWNWFFKSFDNKSTCARSPTELQWFKFYSFLYGCNDHKHVSKLNVYHSVYYAGTDRSSYDQTAYALTHLVLVPGVHTGPVFGDYISVLSTGTALTIRLNIFLSKLVGLSKTSNTFYNNIQTLSIRPIRFICAYEKTSLSTYSELDISATLCWDVKHAISS